MKPHLITALVAAASVSPSMHARPSLNLRPPEETIAAARNTEVRDGNAVEYQRGGRMRDVRRAGKARKARRGWR